MFNAFIDRLPAVVWALAVAMLTAIVGLLWVLYNGALDREREVKIEYATAVKAAELAASDADKKYRKLESDVKTQQDKAVEDAKDAQRIAADNLASANAAAASLRKQLARYSAASGGASKVPGAAAASTPATRTEGVLAELLGRSDERAGILAQEADRARLAGITCERFYDSVVTH